MKWSSLSSVQVAYLQLNSKAEGYKIGDQGKVMRKQPARFKSVTPNPKLELARGMRAAERDRDRERDAANKAWMLGLTAASQVAVRKLPPGKARGASYLNRPRAGALNMGFYLGSGWGTAGSGR